jgi:hypothetical protein
MFILFSALPLAAQLVIAAADGVPKLDVTPSCRGAAAAASASETGDLMRLCLDSEQRSYDQLLKQWSEFLPADRIYCSNKQKAFEPTYTELLTCLEMARDVKKIKRLNGDTL